MNRLMWYAKGIRPKCTWERKTNCTNGLWGTIGNYDSESSSFLRYVDTLTYRTILLIWKTLGFGISESFSWLLRRLQDPIYRPNYYLSLQEFRELTTQRVVKFVGQGFFSVMDYIQNPLKFQAALESLSFCDYSLAIKSGMCSTWV